MIRIWSMLATARPKKATISRSSARDPSVTSARDSTPMEANARRLASSMASPTNDQLSVVDTPGIASDTLPGDHSTRGSVDSQWSGSLIGMAGPPSSPLQYRYCTYTVRVRHLSTAEP